LINPNSKKIKKGILFFDQAENILASELSKIKFDKYFVLNKSIEIPIIIHSKNKKYKELDFNESFSDIEIVSEKLKNLIGDNDITYFKIETCNYKTEQNYYLIKVNNFYDCVDETQSEIEFIKKDNTDSIEWVGKYMKLGKFFIDNNKVGNAKIFRLEKYFPQIIFREDLVEVIINNKITGMDFINTWESR
jgi:hypothetical protein